MSAGTASAAACDEGGGGQRLDPASRYAVCTLLTLGDGYLPGVMALGWSFREQVPRERCPNVELVLMATPDVSEAARSIALAGGRAYDRVVSVPALQTHPSCIAHRDPATRERYAALFSKFNYFGLEGYKRVLFLDADMLVLRGEPLVRLLALRVPLAAVFYGCERPYAGERARLSFQQRVCARGMLRHGQKPPRGFVSRGCATPGMMFETSVVLAEPSQSRLRAARSAVASFKGKVASDTGMFNRLFARDAAALNTHFLGRWQLVRPGSPLVTLDSYGYMYKPWHSARSPYFDVAFWRARFLQLLAAARASLPPIDAATLSAHRDIAAAETASRAALLASLPERGGVLVIGDGPDGDQAAADPEGWAQKHGVPLGKLRCGFLPDGQLALDWR